MNLKYWKYCIVASFRKCVVIVLVIYLSRAGSTKMEILNLSKNCEDCKKLQGFCEKHIWCDINASIYFSKLPKEIKQRDIVPAHKTKTIWVSAFIKLNLLIVEGVIDLQICRALISGPDPKLKIGLLETSQLWQKMW